MLRGVTRSGKSTLAKALGDPSLFGFGRPFVQTVQSAADPDLRDYDMDNDGYIVFDNVNDMSFILRQRALFQANNDIHTLGASATGIYSYSVLLWRVPIVCTVDTSAAWDEREDWIKENCFSVQLDGPCYFGGAVRDLYEPM